MCNILKRKMRNAPRLTPQLAQNGSFCANYKRKYCASKLTHSPHTLASHTRLTKRIVGLLSPSVFSLSLSRVDFSSVVAHSLERGSLFGWLSLSSVDLSSIVALSLSVGLSSAVALSLRGSLFGRGSLSPWLSLWLWLSPLAFSLWVSLTHLVGFLFRCLPRR